jgi:hypothetical protein
MKREDYMKPLAERAKVPAAEIQKEALKQALDIRKFEIDLYWKRATYFWTFIAAALGGYLVAQQNPGAFEISYLLCCIGLVFSVAWYFVNRGSKAWQRNWEAHVDLLEDEVMGPLYKTGVDRYKYRLLDLTAAYPFSVSKINQILNVFVIAIWVFLLGRTLMLLDTAIRPYRTTAVLLSVLSAAAIAWLYFGGRTTKSDDSREADVRRRVYQ